MRKRFIAGNWKMHKNKEEAIQYINSFKKYVKTVFDTDIVLAVPYTLLSVVNNACKGTNIYVSAQNAFYEDEGAYTGEISPKMIKDYADYVIIGHSERRKYFDETNQILNSKIKLALKNDLKVIFCVGETMEQKNKNETKTIIESQIRKGLSKITEKDMKKIVIAYEPVWAIGTGKTASPLEADSVHLFIRELIQQLYSKDSANKLRIIYGGSVNPSNALDILNMESIDGCLPGGASLDPECFSKIIKA